MFTASNLVDLRPEKWSHFINHLSNDGFHAIMFLCVESYFHSTYKLKLKNSSGETHRVWQHPAGGGMD